MEIQGLVAACDTLLEAGNFKDGQHNGLQVEGDRPIRRIMSAVSVSQETIAAAIEAEADVLLTHHGLLWKNQPLHVQGVRRARLKALMDAGIHLVSYHLPLDAHPTVGNNAALADAAGCASTQPAFDYGGQAIGISGTLDVAMPFAAWRDRFEAALRRGCDVGTGPFSVWDFGPETVRKVGFVSGAAPYQVQDAIDAGLDVYVTGEATEGVYHLAKEAGIHFIAGGHYLTERLGVQRLGDWLATRFGIEHAFHDAMTLA